LSFQEELEYYQFLIDLKKSIESTIYKKIISNGDEYIMAKNKKAENMKDKTVGKIKEKVGKATGNEKMEIKGKIQSAKAEVKQEMGTLKENLKEKVKDIKGK
jgi:uncharacterized protein YjbJ (UPF0337 family)